MSDEQENTKEETLNCCEGMPFGEMMRKMMNQQGQGIGLNCAEIIQKMTNQEGECCGFDRSEMMSRMTMMCCQQQDEKEETRKEGKETQTANQ